MFIRGKTLEKPKRGSVNFENKGSGVVYAWGRYQHPTRPSQGTAAFNRVCKNMTSILFIFPFYIYIFIFGVDKGVSFAPTYPQVR